MSSEQIRLQFTTKLFWVNSWIPQMRQWISDSWLGDWKWTGPKTGRQGVRGQAEAVCRHCLQILTANWKFRTGDSWPVYFTVEG